MLDLSLVYASPILIVDDNVSNVTLLEAVLAASGYTNVHSSTNALGIVDGCRDMKIDLILLDLHMPGIDGYEALAMLKESLPEVPVLVFSADVTPQAKTRALSLGASDFLTKPGDVVEICLRVRNFLSMRHLFLHVEGESRRLESLVRERTKDLQEAQIEILGRLAMAAEFRDDDTGQHTKRVSKMSFDIARNLGISLEDASLIQFASLLHDVGKIGIPDKVLLKPSNLTPDEVQLMKTHTTIGGKLLAQSKGKLLQLAEVIAMTHHECWDGLGYPLGLKGEEIPLEGRIVAVADAFDAMISNRVYKRPMPLGLAAAEVERCSGSQFDPRVVAAFQIVVLDLIAAESAAQTAA